MATIPKLNVLDKFQCRSPMENLMYMSLNDFEILISQLENGRMPRHDLIRHFCTDKIHDE
jgi:hypothetical protein